MTLTLFGFSFRRNIGPTIKDLEPMPHAFKAQHHDEPNDAAGVLSMIFSDIGQGQQNADTVEQQQAQEPKQGRSRRARNRATNYE